MLVPLAMWWFSSPAMADSLVGAQGEVQAGFVRSAVVDGRGTDARSKTSVTGLGLLFGGHFSGIGAIRGNDPGIVVQDWWGGEIGIGNQFGRNGNLWYEFDFDFGLRVGMHDTDTDLYVTPLVRTGNFRGLANESGNANYGFGLGLAFRADQLVLEVELPKPHRASSTRSWAEQTSVTVGFGDIPKHMVRWEFTAIGDGSDSHRVRSTTLTYVLRMG